MGFYKNTNLSLFFQRKSVVLRLGKNNVGVNNQKKRDKKKECGFEYKDKEKKVNKIYEK